MKRLKENELWNLSLEELSKLWNSSYDLAMKAKKDKTLTPRQKENSMNYFRLVKMVAVEKEQSINVEKGKKLIEEIEAIPTPKLLQALSSYTRSKYVWREYGATSFRIEDLYQLRNNYVVNEFMLTDYQNFIDYVNEKIK